MNKMTFEHPFMDRGFMDQFFSPVKYIRQTTRQTAEGEGTKDKPFIINRQEVVDKMYHGWYDEDGSYHEILVKQEE